MAEEKSFTAKELAEILAEQDRRSQENLAKIIKELRKPTELEQKEIDEAEKTKQEDLKTRLEISAGIKQKMKNEEAYRSICAHKHNNGFSQCVHVKETEGPGYILCQECQIRVRPSTSNKTLDPTAVYDSALFNRLYQEMPSNALFQ